MVNDNPRDKSRGWIGVDFDGTLALDDRDAEQVKDPSYVGAPIEPMVRRVRKWLREGREVRLFTARRPHPALRRWMVENLGEALQITNKKDHEMQALYDDRVVQVERNTGEVKSSDEEQVWSKD